MGAPLRSPVRLIALAGWAPRAAPASPPQHALNMAILWFKPQGHHEYCPIKCVNASIIHGRCQPQVWLLVILQISSPDVVDLWEALLTLAFFPILVLYALAAPCHARATPRPHPRHALATPLPRRARANHPRPIDTLNLHPLFFYILHSHPPFSSTLHFP